MKLEDFITIAKVLNNRQELWLTNDTFNNLCKAHFRLNQKENMVLNFAEFEIEVSIKKMLISKSIVSFAKIERVTENFVGTQIRKKNIYNSKVTKSIIIL